MATRESFRFAAVEAAAVPRALLGPATGGKDIGAVDDIGGYPESDGGDDGAAGGDGNGWGTRFDG